MNNREVIDQVERGYRMAQPSHISYPGSKGMPKEVAGAQANVYKVSIHFVLVLLISNFFFLYTDNARMLEQRPVQAAYFRVFDPHVRGLQHHHSESVHGVGRSPRYWGPWSPHLFKDISEIGASYKWKNSNLKKARLPSRRQLTVLMTLSIELLSELILPTYQGFCALQESVADWASHSTNFSMTKSHDLFLRARCLNNAVKLESYGTNLSPMISI